MKKAIILLIFTTIVLMACTGKEASNGESINIDEVEEIYLILPNSDTTRSLDREEIETFLEWYNSISDVQETTDWSGTTDAPMIHVITNPPEKGMLITLSVDKSGYLHLQRSLEENYFGRQEELSSLLEKIKEGNISEPINNKLSCC